MKKKLTLLNVAFLLRCPMGTTETIQLVDKLVEAKIPKSTATELVDRIDRGNLEPDNPKWINLENDVQDLKNGVEFVKNDVRWLKWVVALGFPILIGIVTYLHNDMKAEIHSVRTEVKTEIQSVRTEIQSVRTEVKTEIQSVRTEINQLSAKIDQILLQRR